MVASFAEAAVRNSPALMALPAAAALSAALLAQAQFRTETTIVQVDVVVRDRTGRPVEDLDQTAFQVLENGVPQPLVWFERSVGSAGSDGKPSQAAGPVGWNQARDVGTPQSLVALVFHQLGPEARRDTCLAAKAMVDQLPPGDFAAVYLIDQVMTPLTGFTRDRDLLRQAIDTVGITPPAPRFGIPSAPRVAESAASSLGGEPNQIAKGMRNQMETGLNQLDAEYDAGMQGAAFSQLVADLDRFPGRRAVYLFSGGLAMPMVAPRIESVADRAAPRHVSFYAISQGLRMRTYGKGVVTRVERSELTSVSTETERHPAKVSEMDPSLGLRQLAELTGGLYVTGSTDVNVLLARANADRRSFYVLGYRTSAPAAEAGTRPIEVRVSRPGLSVRARTRIGQTAPE